MKIITILLLLLLASPVFGELTKEDLRTILKEEVTASETRIKEYIDLKIETVNARIDAVNTRIDAVNTRIDTLEKSVDGRFDAVADRFDAVDKKLDWVWYMIIALIGLVAATIAIPQIIIAYRDQGRKELQSQIDQLREQIEAMQQ